MDVATAAPTVMTATAAAATATATSTAACTDSLILLQVLKRL